VIRSYLFTAWILSFWYCRVRIPGGLRPARAAVTATERAGRSLVERGEEANASRKRPAGGAPSRKISPPHTLSSRRETINFQDDASLTSPPLFAALVIHGKRWSCTAAAVKMASAGYNRRHQRHTTPPRRAALRLLPASGAGSEQRPFHAGGWGRRRTDPFNAAISAQPELQRRRRHRLLTSQRHSADRPFACPETHYSREPTVNPLCATAWPFAPNTNGGTNASENGFWTITYNTTHPNAYYIDLLKIFCPCRRRAFGKPARAALNDGDSNDDVYFMHRPSDASGAEPASQK